MEPGSASCKANVLLLCCCSGLHPSLKNLIRRILNNSLSRIWSEGMWIIPYSRALPAPPGKTLPCSMPTLMGPSTYHLTCYLTFPQYMRDDRDALLLPAFTSDCPARQLEQSPTKDSAFNLGTDTLHSTLAQEVKCLRTLLIVSLEYTSWHFWLAMILQKREKYFIALIPLT